MIVTFLSLAAACSNTPDLAEPVINRQVATQDEAENLTLEEAGLLAGGQLVSIYGITSDPVPLDIKSGIVELDGQQVWQLDIVVAVTKSGERSEDQWRMWVGTPADGPPAVVQAQQYN